MAEIYKIGSNDIIDRVSEFGGTNLVANSATAVRLPSSGTATAQYTFKTWSIYTLPFVQGEQITISGKIEIHNGTFTTLGIRFYDSAITTNYAQESNSVPIVNGKFTWTSTVGATLAGKTDAKLLVYTGNWGATQGNASTISELKLERGTKPTDWTPAPQDLVTISGTELQFF